MSTSAPDLPDDPAVLKAMIVALRTENAQISATLRAHDLLVQALRVRIAKLKKQAFGKSSEKIEREIEQLELALEDLQVAMAGADTAPPEDRVTDEHDTVADEDDGRKPRRRPRVSDATPRERRDLDPGDSCPDCGGDLRVVGEDVSELIDMIAAQLKGSRSRGSRNPAGAAKGWSGSLRPAVPFREAWRARTCWPAC